ncbi:uncharacterized protein LOC132709902 [Pantherophis guttatus]|uniref:Uncharacterized protein LOC132709902 n=1 Tax=Pantherophis guttatus TaxID=94885 RepID=A0ABM3YXP6_PANGU|nr:uncharacterized protein LOC132709902 [Pantherophis guttatus]
MKEEEEVLLWMNLGADSRTDSSPSTSRLSFFPPHSIFVQGEEMTLKCSVPDTHQLQIFFFRCKNESGSPILEKAHQRNTWNISTAHLNETRKLICSCWSKTHTGTGTKWSYSPQSDSREFLVVEIPPPPLLKLDPLSQREKEGDCLFLLCSAEGSLTEKEFHFYKDGVEITSSEEGLLEPSREPTNPLQRASLRIPHASFSHSGEFACSYEEKRSNRWVTSSWSQGTNITVERGRRRFGCG